MSAGRRWVHFFCVIVTQLHKRSADALNLTFKDALAESKATPKNKERAGHCIHPPSWVVLFKVCPVDFGDYEDFGVCVCGICDEGGGSCKFKVFHPWRLLWRPRHQRRTRRERRSLRGSRLTPWRIHPGFSCRVRPRPS